MSALKGSFAVAWGLAFIAVVNFALAKSGVIQLDVDATRLAEGVLSVQESIPAEPGRVRIAYPKWIPGEHSPSGPVSDVVNFHVLGNGQPLPWARDLEDLFSVWIDVPAGCDSLELRFDYLMNAGGALSARPSASPRTAYLNWYWVFWYERSADLDQTLVEAQLRLPTEWQLGSALDAQRVDERVRFEKVSVRSLFEHPVLLGQHLATYNLAPEDSVPHALHVASDTPEANALKDEQLKAYRRLVKELDALFGTRHYKRYHFLVAISSVLGSNGLEHHECSENRVLEETFLDDTVFSYMGSLLPHEYFHSWNGKFRRPQAMLSPDYQQIMQGDLLWVYEGLTEFYGNVLAARAGIISADFYREQLAASAAYYERQSGRGWRPLVDTGTAIQFGYMSPRAGSNQRRGVDVYSESELLWLEAHALLQTASSGKRGIDDFARRFIDGAEQAPAGAPKTLGVSISPYKESDVIGALQAIAPADWTSFIAKRVHQTGATPPASVLRALGWELVYTGEENAALAAGEKVSSSTGFDATLGFSLSSEAKVEDLDPASPAGKAGLPIGSTVIGVNGRKFSLEGLKAAVRESEKTGAVELLVENGSFLKTYRLVYSGGPKNPHLKRIEGTPDLLTPLISSLSAP